MILRGRLFAVSLLVGIVIPASGALAAEPRQATKVGADGIEIRLLGAAARSRDPLARSYIVDRIAPGTTIRRRVQITNNTASTATVGVYPAAAILQRGKFGFAGGHSENELSSWISVSQNALSMSPAARMIETVTIAVPEQASAGERYAVVWAEVSAPAPASGGVTLVTRVGVRVYLSIGPGGALPANFSIGSLSAERPATGELVVAAKVHNSGRRTLDIVGDLTLSEGPGGLRAGPFPVKVGTALAPGVSRVVKVRLDKRLPRGPWHARMRLRSGFVQRAATATITFPRPAANTRTTPARSHHLILGLLILLALAAVALVFVGRVRRNRPRLQSLTVGR
jgi:hypothetical protein